MRIYSVAAGTHYAYKMSVAINQMEKSEVYHVKDRLGKALTKPDDLNSLIEGLTILFSYDKVNIDQVREYMSSYESNPNDWKKYSKFDAHK